MHQEDLPAVDEEMPGFITPNLGGGSPVPGLSPASSSKLLRRSQNGGTATPVLTRQLSSSRSGERQMMKLAQVREAGDGGVINGMQPRRPRQCQDPNLPRTLAHFLAKNISPFPFEYSQVKIEKATAESWVAASEYMKASW